MKSIRRASITLLLVLTFASASVRAQAPSGPLIPQPGTPIQQSPKNAQGKVKVQVALVNTPVTVRDAKGEMVHNLEAKDFQITDNGVPQKITHFDLGGDPLSLVIANEVVINDEYLLHPSQAKEGVEFRQNLSGQLSAGLSPV
jgi:hypothetical protein